MLAYCLFCMVVAYFTAKYSKERIEQLQVIHQTNDSKEELQMMMEAKNKELIRRQEDEIHMATLQERNRIAREIHDNVGHMLTRAILLTAAMKTQTNFQQSEELTVLKQTLDTAMNEIRSSVHDLHDEAIDLKESIHSIIQNYSFCPIALDYDMEEEVEREIKVCFIAVIKEALSNTAKHSNATQVTILVREHPALYQLLIQDNGSKQEASKEHGIGIENMEERVKSLHGQISITNQNGYRIFISIPKKG